MKEVYFRLKTHTFDAFHLSTTLKRPKTLMKTETFENGFKRKRISVVRA